MSTATGSGAKVPLECKLDSPNGSWVVKVRRKGFKMASEHLENFKSDVTCGLHDVIPGPVIAKDKVS